MKLLKRIKLNYEAYKIFCRVRRILKEEQDFEYKDGYLYDLLIVQETALRMVRPKTDKNRYYYLYKDWIRKNHMIPF
jgi:hypothetical protein